MDSRQQRVGKNESLFREVNERIEEVSEQLGDTHDGRTDFLCECGERDCTAPISLSLEEYERVRSDPTHFAILPGHEMIDVERVREQNERFAVVEKFAGAAERIALERDPRS